MIAVKRAIVPIILIALVSQIELIFAVFQKRFVSPFFPVKLKTLAQFNRLV